LRQLSGEGDGNGDGDGDGEGTETAVPGRYDRSNFHASAFGKRTAELYIDPYSAVVMKEALENPGKIEPDQLSYLHVIASTTDMIPLFLRRNERERLEDVFENRMDSFFIHPFMDEENFPEEHEYEEFLSWMKTALMLEMWLEEKSEDDICKSHNIGPGDLRSKVEIGEWLLYSMREIATLRKKRDDARRLGELVIRIRHGAKAELLPLLHLKGIGRVRARTLFNAGYQTPQALRSADVREIAKLPGIGKVLAAKMKEQLESM
jgi:helicase